MIKFLSILGSGIYKDTDVKSSLAYYLLTRNVFPIAFLRMLRLSFDEGHNKRNSLVLGIAVSIIE